MKYSTQDLLLALQVRDLAVRRRLNKAPNNLSPEQKAAWAEAQDFDEFVVEVTEELEGIAEVIRKSQSE